MKDDAPRVIKIPAKPEATRQAEARRQLRVAAYCRVSTKEEDQANSYEVQKEYYTDKIMSNTAWTMAGIFADKGITGTSAKKREDFMRMIRHCRQKKIDVHALALQEHGFEVKAIDVSPLSCDVMKARGIEDVECVNLFDTQLQSKFDTILLLMNGTGIAGKLSRLPLLLNRLKELMAEGAQILIDSSDLKYIYENDLRRRAHRHDRLPGDGGGLPGGGVPERFPSQPPGVSPFSMQLAGSVVVVIMNHALKENGGDLAIGASGIISSIAMLLVMLIIGIAQGMQPIVGFNHGAGHHDRVFATLRLSIIVSTLITGVGCIVSLLFPRLIVSVFSTDAELVSITDNGLRLTMLVFFVVGSQITISQFFQSIGVVFL